MGGAGTGEAGVLFCCTSKLSEISSESNNEVALAKVSSLMTGAF